MQPAASLDRPMLSALTAQPDNGRILVVDDEPRNVRLLADLLRNHGFEVETAADGNAALELVERCDLDVVLLDVLMPGKSGYEVCRELRRRPDCAALPVVLITALDEDQRVKGLEAGADELITKPWIDQELLARVRRLVATKRIYDQVEAQSTELRRINENLSRIVDEKVREINRLSKLKRFLAPKLAERVISGDADDPWRLHRRDIVVVFFDLRGFTAFSEVSAPEDVMAMLRDFHARIGGETLRYSGTIERFAGDGVMVFFNDPEPIAAPCEHGVRFAHAALAACAPSLELWRRRGFSIDVAAAIAYGFATLGAIGFEDRMDYGAIGPVTNLAARLCGDALAGEILMSGRVASELPASFKVEKAGLRSLKGFRDLVEAYRLVAIADAGPA